MRAQTPVVQPGDISTPTPGPLFPTPTPLPASTLPVNTHDGSSNPRTYTVRPGDTLFDVALEIGLDIGDVPCAIAPDYRPSLPLVIGDELEVPPANMGCHQVEPGETLASIADRFDTTAAAIHAVRWNQLDQKSLRAGAYLRVPLAVPASWTEQLMSDDSAQSSTNFLALMLRMPVNTSPFEVLSNASKTPTRTVQRIGPVPADWIYGSGRFAWPVYGWLSQSYRYDHRAVDIAATQGTPVTAADRGVVIRAGWNNQGYGQFVVVDHNIDYVTLYAHLDKLLVDEGDVVGKGQIVGTVGSTGNSTGPHLHFEVRDFGRLVNPLELLALN